MKIGIAFDVRPSESPVGAPDDWAEEFDAPETIAAIASALRSMNHQVLELGNGRSLVERLLHERPDLVFNLAEGSGASRNRESRVPALCELLNIPCTGSDPLTLGIALDKSVCRTLVAAADVRVPSGIVIPRPPADYDGDYSEFVPILAEAGISGYAIAKPVWEGSSKGIRNRCLVENHFDLGGILRELWSHYAQPVLVEEFIDGEELTVGIVGNDPPHVLGVMHVVPRDRSRPFVYSLEVKRNYREMVDYDCPPKLPTSLLRDVEAAALTAWEATGCRDVGRLDFRIRDGEPYFLELNPLPGLNPISSDLVLIARAVGVSYAELIDIIVNTTVSRCHL